ncbi:MAG TPA: hypothetical protein PKN70_02140 [Smithellaceae bacterium]|nr:hypothetical protein [Smithellaceae bacterium]HQM44871.1 hypothetical protein [Smithellaceae bacterium]
MNGKQRCNQRASPKCACQAMQKKKKQNSIQDMEQNIGPVVTARFPAEQLPIQHMGKHCQRMPVARADVVKNIQSAPPGQSLLHLVIFCHIQMVIIISKTKILNIPVNDQRQ